MFTDDQREQLQSNEAHYILLNAKFMVKLLRIPPANSVQYGSQLKKLCECKGGGGGGGAT